MAVGFAKAGFSVAINYCENETEAKKTAELVHSAGAKSLLLKADVRDSNQVKEMFKKLLSQWSHLDVLVNNAGIARNRSVAKMSDDEWKDVMDVILNGTFFCTREALPLMRPKKDGVILNIASFASTHGLRGAANYATAKAGIIAFTKSVALEEGPTNIRVNAIMPGFHVTDMNRETFAKISEDVLKQHLLGKLSDLTEMSEFIVTIAKLKSVTGQVYAFESRLF